MRGLRNADCGLRIAKRAETAAAWVAFKCPFCFKKGGAVLKHYDLMRCACGVFFWALQPLRDGPLELFQHPGFYPKT